LLKHSREPIDCFCHIIILSFHYLHFSQCKSGQGHWKVSCS